MPPVGADELVTNTYLDGRLAELESRMDARFSRLETSLMRNFVTWLLATQAGWLSSRRPPPVAA